MIMHPIILFEDGDMLAVDKPPGLVTHPDGKTDEPTLVDWLLEHYPDMAGVGEPLRLPDGVVIDRPGIVHRIDRETSGVLIIAKNQAAFKYLKAQFKNRQVEKTYHVFLRGVIKDEQGVIDRPIGKSRKDFRLRLAIDPNRPAVRQARGTLREALTEYRVLARGNDSTYVEAHPKTGRTHQLRVHFKAINYPIVCDKLYAPKRGCILGFKRLALHASSLSLSVPNGKRLTVEAPLPADFEQALAQLKAR